MTKKINKNKLIKRIIIVILLISIVGFYLANRTLKSYGYAGVFDLISTYQNNSKLADQVQPKSIQLKLSESDYEFIKNRRQIALDRGLQINDGNNYVDCNIITENDSSKGVMRLKGHMTDHLQGDKWSFRVKSQKPILGMKRFSLQHPGTRNYVYEWIYHQLLKNEDVIYLNYDFVNVSLNDKDLGIYALEEHFGQHVLERNNRPKGAILRWNPNLYWEWRIDEFQGYYLNEEYSAYSSTFAEPYDKGVVMKDEALIENYQMAALKLDQFRTGQLSTSQVFDVEKMARFHAIIDLVGGHHSLDWSDVKFYYNSETKKVEPVGYESFSIRKTDQIAGQQIRDDYSDLQLSYHKQLFADPVFYAAYIKNLERIADESYLKAFIDLIQDELNQKIGIIAKEWPYRKFDFEGYFENIRLIQNNLNLPKPFHAFTQTHNKDSITLTLAPVSDFPIEIIGLKKKNKTFESKQIVVLPAKARHTVIKYFDLTFYGNFKKAKDLVLLAKIPGSSHVFEVEVAKYPSYKFNILDVDSDENQLIIDTSLTVINGQIITFKNQDVTLKSKTVIPQNYSVNLHPGQTLTIEDSVIINGEFNTHGFTDLEINIKTNKNGLLVVNGKLAATNTQFTGSQVIKSNRGELEFYQCQVFDVTNYFIQDYQSKIVLNTCQSGSVGELFKFNETESYFKNCNFKKGDVFAVSNGGYINMKSTHIEGYKKVSTLNYNAQFYMWDTEIMSSDTMFTLKNASSYNSYGGLLSDFNVGFVLEENTPNLKGKSEKVIYKTTTQNFKSLEVIL